MGAQVAGSGTQELSKYNIYIYMFLERERERERFQETTYILCSPVEIKKKIAFAHVIIYPRGDLTRAKPRANHTTRNLTIHRAPAVSALSAARPGRWKAERIEKYHWYSIGPIAILRIF